MKTEHDLRCHCERRTKLGVFGRTEAGEPYLHIRVFKQSRVYGEVFVTSGEVKILCRDCRQCMLVRVVGRTPHIERGVAPPVLVAV